MADPQIDHRFEFDAPRFYDFKTMTSDCSPADDWFDTAPEGPGKRPTGASEVNREPFKTLQAAGGSAKQHTPGPSTSRKQPLEKATPKAAQKPKTPRAKPTPKAKAPAPKAQQPEPDAAPLAPQPSKPAVGNIVTSWGDSARNLKRTRAQPDDCGAAAARAGPAAASGAAGGASGESGAGNGAAGGCLKARRVSAAQASPRAGVPVTRSQTRMLRLAFTPIPEKKAKHFSPPKTRQARTAAKPRTPAHKRAAAGGVAGSRLRQVLEAKVSKPARSTKPLTLPDDFDLETSKRARSCKAAQQAPAASPFKSLAQKVLDFQSKTPQRFRVTPRVSAGAGGRTASAGTSRGRARQHNPQQPQITEAKTPVLWTSTRSRPRRFKTREEEEEEELSREREAAAFHARPVDPAVLSGALATARKPAEKKAPTEPKPFSFNVDKRAESRTRGRASVGDGRGRGEGPQRGGAEGAGCPGMQGPQTRLRTAMMAGGRSILDGGLLPGFSAPAQQAPGRSASNGRSVSASRQRMSLTIPKSPFLRTKTRHYSPPKAASPKPEFKARPAPTFDLTGAKSVPFVPPKEATRPAPFHLATDERHKQHETHLKAALEADRRKEERMRRVSARPLPATTDMPAVPPRPEPKELTMPAPYRLRSEVRHAEAVQRHHEELQREEEARRQAAEFKARPMWAGKPFAVHESDAPLTVPEDPNLATEERAEDREEFDRTVAEKMQQQEEERRRQEELKRQREEEETREYRRSLRFKARPMPKFDEPFFSQPSDRPLTNPQTPDFASKKRARQDA